MTGSSTQASPVAPQPSEVPAARAQHKPSSSLPRITLKSWHRAPARASQSVAAPAANGLQQDRSGAPRVERPRNFWFFLESASDGRHCSVSAPEAHPSPVPKPVVGRWFLYIVRCGDGSLYTGIAIDVARRLAAHSAGRGARYTRGRGPLALVAYRRCDSKSAALRLELAVKRLPRAEKESLLRKRGLARFARDLIQE